MGGGGNDPEYRLSDLQALWQENGTEHFVRFTTEQSDEAKYLYGREWDEAEDVYEIDLYRVESKEIEGEIVFDTIPLYGNGWFKYWFETNGGLHELHLMDNHGAEIPKEYIVSKLTSTTLEYYEKNRQTNKFYFSKVVSPK